MSLRAAALSTAAIAVVALGRLGTNPRNRAMQVPTASEYRLTEDPTLRFKVDGARPDQLKNRPSLINYNPVANPGAVVTSPDGFARFTVLTDRLIRMEYAAKAGVFEDHSTIAMLNRNLPVPQFTQSTTAGVLTIKTTSVALSYTLGQPFSASTLSVASLDPTSAFKGWSFGQPFPGNLLGTIRGLDGQDNTPLNCTLNAAILDNGELNHCEWGMVSRDGWVVYDDTPNFILDENDWWIPVNNSGPAPPRSCSAGTPNTDASSPTRASEFPNGIQVASAAACCNACFGAADCTSWVYDTQAANPNCWPLASSGGTVSAQDRVFGVVQNVTTGTQQDADAADLYGFFHGHDYAGALVDFTAVSGKTIMVPRSASGIWWSRWFDVNNKDILDIAEAYDSNRIPLDL